jgi:transcriptional regulator with XRE-family HTH domain
MKVVVSDLQIRAWRRKGYSLERIAQACGLTTSQMSRRLRQMYSMDQAKQPDPGPDEINAVCAQIQREWSEEERRRRDMYRVGRWQPAVVPVCVMERLLD